MWVKACMGSSQVHYALWPPSSRGKSASTSKIEKGALHVIVKYDDIMTGTPFNSGPYDAKHP